VGSICRPAQHSAGRHVRGEWGLGLRVCFGGHKNTEEGDCIRVEGMCKGIGGGGRTEVELCGVSAI